MGMRRRREEGEEGEEGIMLGSCVLLIMVVEQWITTLRINHSPIS